MHACCWWCTVLACVSACCALPALRTVRICSECFHVGNCIHPLFKVMSFYCFACWSSVFLVSKMFDCKEWTQRSQARAHNTVLAFHSGFLCMDQAMQMKIG